MMATSQTRAVDWHSPDFGGNVHVSLTGSWLDAEPIAAERR